MQLAIQSFGRTQRLLHCLFLFVFCFGNQAFGQSASLEPIDVILKFKRDLYVLAETKGGDAKEWDLLEGKAAAALVAALERSEEGLKTLDGNERSLLHLASSDGYLFFVKILLSRDIPREWINLRDKHGLTAYEYALLALRETLWACHPKIENPFLLVPFVVQIPYYDNRKPFREIARLLEQAGTDRSIENARGYWLDNCSNSDLAARSKVENSKDLYGTLTEITLVIEHEQKKRRLEKWIENWTKLTQAFYGDARPTPEELKAKIEEKYREAGLTPPD